MATKTVTAGEARSHFPQIASMVVETGEPVTVFRNSRPWVSITPIDPTESEGYAELIIDCIERGMKDIEEGRYYVGTDAVRAEIARREGLDA